jgi:endonuclease G
VTAKRKRTRRAGSKAAKGPALSPFLRDAGGLTRRQEQVLEAALVRFGSRPDVAAVDFGFKWTAGVMRSTLCLRIHLREKVPTRYVTPRERIPKTFMGMPTDVLEAPHRQHGGGGLTLPRSARVAVLRPGVSVGALGGPAGTLGLLVRDADDGAPALLTAAHVLTADPTAGPGEPILQPARFDGGQPQDTIAALERADFETDSAIARLFQTARATDPAIEGNGGVVTALSFPAFGMLLEKSGRSTGVTQGIVDGLTPSGWGVRFVMHIVPLPGATRPIADAGDSGAVWCDSATGNAVGLHCQGAANATAGTSFAVATSMPHVFSRLRLTL